MLNTFIKDPDAELDYEVDWSQWLKAGDQIVDASFSVPSGLSQILHSTSGTGGIVWIGGGEAGKKYQITHRIVTQEGRKDDRSFLIRVQER